jgi:hypothetical protein
MRLLNSKRLNANLLNHLGSKPYQDMFGRLIALPEPVVYEPFRYYKNCQVNLVPERPELNVEDMLRPPRSLGELLVQELNPRNYR